MSFSSSASAARLALPPAPAGVVSLVCFPARDVRKDRLLQWELRDSTANANELFVLFDDKRRLEVRQSGLYRVKIYLETVDTDFSKYHLEVNGFSVSSFGDAMFSTGSHTDKGAGGAATATAMSAAMSMAAAQHVASRAALSQEALVPHQMNVTELRLSKWDMLVVRRKPNFLRQYGGRSAFGRLVLEAVRLDA